MGMPCTSIGAVTVLPPARSIPRYSAQGKSSDALRFGMSTGPTRVSKCTPNIYRLISRNISQPQRFRSDIATAVLTHTIFRSNRSSPIRAASCGRLAGVPDGRRGRVVISYNVPHPAGAATSYPTLCNPDLGYHAP